MQIAATLRHAIQDEEITGVMPSAREIQSEYHCSIDTANKALRLLADEGLIKRWPGLAHHVL